MGRTLPFLFHVIRTDVNQVWKNSSVFKGDSGKIFAVGTSAGAGLALSVTRAALLGYKDLPTNAIKGVVALAPVTLHPENVPSQFQGEYSSYRENGDNVPVINKASMDEFFASVAAESSDPSHFVGLDGETQKLFPPTYIVTCEFDPLRDDGTVFLGALQSKGVEVRHDRYSGLPHCFWIFPTLPETQKFLGNLFDGIKWVLERK